MTTQITVPNARRAFGGLIVLSGIGLAAFTAMNRPILGVGVFFLAFVGAVLVQAKAERSIFDERDKMISKDAAASTLTIFGWASFGVFPTLTAAWGLGIFEWGAWINGIAFFVTVLYLTYGLFVFILQRRR
jgi:uncharacterized membrane protein